MANAVQETAEEMHQALQIAKKLNKFIPLPNRANWKVHQSDVLHRGRALSLLRTKRNFFVPDDLSSLKSRSITVTRHGFMIIYEQQSLGLIVDLRAASHVFCTADKFKGRTGEYARCHVKIRLPRGNVHLFVRDGEVHKWSCAIMQATSLMGDKNKKRQEKQEKVPEVKEEVEEAPEAPKAPEEEDELQSPSPVTVIERRVPEASEASVASGIPQAQSLVSVRSLREKLEKELVIRPKSDVIADQNRRKEPSFISSLFFPAPSEDVILEEDEVFTEEQSIVMMPLEKEEMEREKPKKDWWNRSLRC